MNRRAATVTQFVARALDIASFPPPEQKRGSRYGAGAICWLCGGETGGEGWPQSLAIAPTFTNHNQAKAPQSDSVCQSCAAMTRAESWQSVVARRNMTMKTWTQAGWHSYSHFVRDTGHYECPVPSRVREILLSPPDGSWVIALNPSGKKHTLFRATVSTGSAKWSAQYDETRIYATTDDFACCLAAFEAITALGISKDDALTGRYSTSALLRAGAAAWRVAEEGLRPWRDERPDLIELVHFCARSATAQGYDFEAAKSRSVGAPKPVTLEPPTLVQGALF